VSKGNRGYLSSCLLDMALWERSMPSLASACCSTAASEASAGPPAEPRRTDSTQLAISWSDTMAGAWETQISPKPPFLPLRVSGRLVSPSSLPLSFSLLLAYFLTGTFRREWRKDGKKHKSPGPHPTCDATSDGWGYGSMDPRVMHAVEVRCRVRTARLRRRVTRMPPQF
jgi:hypothetical protein